MARGGRPKHSKGSMLDLQDAARLREKLVCGEDLVLADILQVLQAQQAPCEDGCKGRKDNPNCLCGLVPAEGGYRKKGLWQKQPKRLADLGADPAAMRHQDPDKPHGLNNLGNTCYVNSALQCLFMTPAFRAGIYQIESPLADTAIVGHLRQLFAQMQAGPKFSTDPTAFAKALQLDHTIQQDGQEFFKLLLSLLEAQLARSSQQDVRTLVQDLFRGSQAFKTTCMRCGRPSASSNNVTHFYELDLMVKGAHGLQSSLADMLDAEQLTGDNQYYCEFCGIKFDATRQLCLHELPPYLCFSLKRLVFDMKKMAKVKVSDKFAFPLEVDMSPFLQPEATAPPGCLTYELAGILVHKGGSASQGHYVAHVRDEASGKWWRFDDETVTEMPQGPIGDKGDHGGVAPAAVSASKKSVAGGAGRGKKRKAKGKSAGDSGDVVDCTDDPYEFPGDAQPPVRDAGITGLPATAQENEGVITSCNAYMLLYKQRGWQPPTAACPASLELPESLQQVLTQEHKDFEAACTSHQAMQESVQMDVDQHRSAVRQIVAQAPVRSVHDDSRLVSAEWLQQWVDSDPELKPIKNEAPLCTHGQLSPDKPPDTIKRITVEAWTELVERCGGGPQLAPEDLCTACLLQRLEAMHNEDAEVQQRDAMLAAVAALEAADERGGSQDFYVSRQWIQNWRTRKGRMTVASGSKAKVVDSPTDNITCPHGDLLPESAGTRARRISLPRDLWGFVRDSWQAAELKRAQEAAEAATEAATAAETAAVARQADLLEGAPADRSNGNSVQADSDCVMVEADGAPLAGPGTTASSPAPPDKDAVTPRELATFNVGHQDCRLCLRDLASSRRQGQAVSEAVEDVKSSLPHLAAGTALHLEPESIYALVPQNWLQVWRAWIKEGSRKQRVPGGCVAEAPPQLAQALQGVMCECHGRLLNYEVPAVVHRRGRWMQVDASEDPFELVAMQDWEQLALLYGPEGDDLFQSRAPTARLKVSGPSAEQAEQAAAPPLVAGSLADERVYGDDPFKPIQGAATASRPAQQGFLESTPPVCQQAVTARAAALMAHKLTYTGVEVFAELVTEEDLRNASTAVGSSVIGARKSKRARKGRVPMTVSSHDTVHDLRLKIVQTFTMHPGNVQIHKLKEGQWQKLEEDKMTLAGCSILPGEELAIANSHEHDDEDYASFFSDSDFKPTGHTAIRERGFQGTALQTGSDYQPMDAQLQEVCT